MSRSNGALAFGGELSLKKVLRPNFGSPGIQKATVGEMVRLGFPQRGLGHEVNEWRCRNLRHLLRGMRDVRAANKGRAPTLIGFLHLAKILRDGTRIEYGLAGGRVVTDAWVAFLVDSMQDAESNLIDVFNFHGLGTGVTAEAAGDTALVTELTTEYASDNNRPAGTLTEGASANIYRTVATNTLDAQGLLREHGIFNQTANSGGTLLDRTLFGLITIEAGESLQSTYELTCTAGG